MSVPDLEARLRRLRLADPPPDLGERILAEAAVLLHLQRRLRTAVCAAAAALLLAVGTAALPGSPTAPAPAQDTSTSTLAIEFGLPRTFLVAEAAPRFNLDDLRTRARMTERLLRGETP